MKTKIKTIASNYDSITGISTASIVSEIGIFNASAKLHPDDKEIASKYAGCEYAEARAILKYAKEKMKIIRYQVDALEEVLHNLENRKNYNENNIEIKIIKEKIDKLDNEKNLIDIRAFNLKMKLENDIKMRPEMVNQIRKKKNKQDNE